MTQQPPRRPTVPSAEESVDRPGQAHFIAGLPQTGRVMLDPQKYTDGRDAVRWMRRFEAIALLNGWNDDFKLHVFEFYVNGEALEWAEGVRRRRFEWRTFKRAFLSRFDNGEAEQARRELSRVVREEEQTLLQLLSRVQWLCSRIDDRMEDADIIDYFTRALDSNDFMLVSMTGALSSLDKLTEMLERQALHDQRRNKPAASEARPVSAWTAQPSRPDDRSPSRDRRRFDSYEDHTRNDHGTEDNRLSWNYYNRTDL